MPDSDTQTLALVQEHFHKLIRARAAELVEELEVELPVLKRELDMEPDEGLAWFPVPGMYGGFAYAWDPERVGKRLIVDSWCRVVGASGQRHEVTATGYTLLEEGF